jgi:hypothetical protein
MDDLLGRDAPAFRRAIFGFGCDADSSQAFHSLSRAALDFG